MYSGMNVVLSTSQPTSSPPIAQHSQRLRLERGAVTGAGGTNSPSPFVPSRGGSASLRPNEQAAIPIATASIVARQPKCWPAGMMARGPRMAANSPPPRPWMMPMYKPRCRASRWRATMPWISGSTGPPAAPARILQAASTYRPLAIALPRHERANRRTAAASQWRRAPSRVASAGTSQPAAAQGRAKAADSNPRSPASMPSAATIVGARKPTT